jgi:hypothetical protein
LPRRLPLQQTSYWIPRRKAANQPVLDLFHAASGRWLEVVVAAQVKNAVHKVADEFERGCGLKRPRLVNGIVEADEEFAMDVFGGAAAMIEGDDVR